MSVYGALTYIADSFGRNEDVPWYECGHPVQQHAQVDEAAPENDHQPPGNWACITDRRTDATEGGGRWEEGVGGGWGEYK